MYVVRSIQKLRYVRVEQTGMVYGIWYDGDGDDGSLKVIYIYMPIRRTRFPVLIPVYCTLLIPVPLLLLPSLPPSPIAE